MIRLTTKLQLVAFFVITVLGIAYVGINYIGINPLKQPFTVHLTLKDGTGGVFTNADVTDRGVVVGKVGALTIAPNNGGVDVDLLINHGQKIPLGSAADNTLTTAQVSNLSAVGEQYVELEPKAASGPYLRSGSQLSGTIPTDDATILRNLEGLLASVNVHDLSTVVKELGKGFNNLGPSLQSLIDNGDALTQAAANDLPETEKLINDGRTVLDTQDQISGELKQFASSFSDVTDTVAGKDTSLRTILDNGSAASTQLKTLLQDNEDAVPTLLSNLNTFTGIQDVRIPYTRAVLELYPAIVADSFYALPKPGSNGISTARFGLVLDNTNSGCTSGYSSTKQRGNTAKDWGGAANLNAYCHGDNAKLNASETNIRGSRNDPKPAGGDDANVTNSDPYDGPHYGQSFPGSGKVGSCGTTSCLSTTIAKASAAKVSTSSTAQSDSPAAVIAAPYDPNTGVIEGLDGKFYELGLNGPLAPVFGSSSYTWLLIAPTMR